MSPPKENGFEADDEDVEVRENGKEVADVLGFGGPPKENPEEVELASFTGAPKLNEDDLGREELLSFAGAPKLKPEDDPFSFAGAEKLNPDDKGAEEGLLSLGGAPKEKLPDEEPGAFVSLAGALKENPPDVEGAAVPAPDDPPNENPDVAGLESDDFDSMGGGKVKEDLADKGAGLGVNVNPLPSEGDLLSVELLAETGGGVKVDPLAGGGVDFAGAGAADAPLVWTATGFLESNSFCISARLTLYCSNRTDRSAKGSWSAYLLMAFTKDIFKPRRDV